MVSDAIRFLVQLHLLTFPVCQKASEINIYKPVFAGRSLVNADTRRKTSTIATTVLAGLLGVKNGKSIVKHVLTIGPPSDVERLLTVAHLCAQRIVLFV